MMHMTLYWGIEVTLLFDFWKTDSWLGYLLTLLACFLFASFYQYMEDRRLRFKTLSSTNPAAPSFPGTTATPLLVKLGRVSGARVSATVLFGVTSALGYLLMLAIMSFNGGVFLAIVLGFSVGYFFFRHGDAIEEVVVVDSPCGCS